jgi:hypothetical protein
MPSSASGMPCAGVTAARSTPTRATSTGRAQHVVQRLYQADSRLRAARDTAIRDTQPEKRQRVTPPAKWQLETQSRNDNA